MKYKCLELNKDFETKSEMFKALRESHEDIIASKKAQIYNSKKGEHKGGVNITSIKSDKLNGVVKGVEIDDDFYYIAVNTTRILDSHKDVSGDGSWNKTTKEQQEKVYLIWDHDYSGSNTIVRKEYIEMFVAKIPFSLLGKPYDGETEALIYKFRKDKVIDKKAKEWLESGDAIEASVRLQYVKILFALNSEDPEDKEFKKNYDKYHPLIANKEDFINEIDYFWQVLEQKNVLESSLVLAGSNHVTGQISEEGKQSEPIVNHSEKHNEPTKQVTQEESIKEIRNFKFV